MLRTALPSLFFLLSVLGANAASTTLTPGSAASIQNMKEKIKNVVVLVMENRSLDNLLGGQKLEGLDNPINNGPFCNPANISIKGSPSICSAPADYNSVTNDPDHSVSGNNLEFYGTFLPDDAQIQSGDLTPDMMGFVTEQIRVYGAKQPNDTVLADQVMHYYSEEEVPVLTALSQNSVVFNHWHSDHPGPTNPNRLFITSGTSHGMGTNNFDFNQLPQKSMFQAASETGHTWKSYQVDGSEQDALWYTWTYNTNNTNLVQPMDAFFADAALGQLPDLAYINPSCCGNGTNSMHPTGWVTDGQQFIKDIYEALRMSPQWNNTMWILTFDETGGFHDHVQPPLAVRPDNLTYTETTPNGQNYTFSFDRLGGRLPTWLISPWVTPQVEQKGTNSDSKSVSYSASSTLRTIGYLWDWEPFTPRVEKAASFDHLIGTTASKSFPTALPEVMLFV